MAHVFRGMAPSDFLPRQQRCGKRVVAVVCCGRGRGGSGWRARGGGLQRGKARHEVGYPRSGGRLVFDVAIGARREAFAAQLGQTRVKIFARLAEIGIAAVAQPADGKAQRGQRRRFFAKEQAVQAERFFRRLALALGGGHEQQHLFVGDGFRLVVGGVDALGVNALFCQRGVQFVRDFARVPGLRGGKDGYGKRRRRGFCAGWRVASRHGDGGQRSAVRPRPAIAGEPGELQRREAIERGGEVGRDGGHDDVSFFVLKRPPPVGEGWGGVRWHTA